MDLIDFKVHPSRQFSFPMVFCTPDPTQTNDYQDPRPFAVHTSSLLTRL